MFSIYSIFTTHLNPINAMEDYGYGYVPNDANVHFYWVITKDNPDTKICLGEYAITIWEPEDNPMYKQFAEYVKNNLDILEYGYTNNRSNLMFPEGYDRYALTINTNIETLTPYS